MILDWVLDMLHGLARAAFDSLPDFEFSIPGDSHLLYAHLSRFDLFVPVTEMATCIGITGTLLGFYVLMKWTKTFIDWLANGLGM